MTLGDIIKSYRSKYGLSMDSFFDKSGISKAYISLLEKNGFSNCSADKAIGEKLLKEKDIKEAPMFLITAYR